MPRPACSIRDKIRRLSPTEKGELIRRDAAIDFRFSFGDRHPVEEGMRIAMMPDSMSLRERDRADFRRWPLARDHSEGCWTLATFFLLGRNAATYPQLARRALY